MKNATVNRNHEKKLSSIFRALRLAAAQVILCYENPRNSMPMDIQHVDHVSELSEEYAFRALCLWLVTTSGSSAYNKAISSDLRRVSNRLCQVWLRAQVYPFANVLSDGSFSEFFEKAEKLLDGCSAEFELIGSLYEHIHKFPMHCDADGNLDIPIHIQEKDKRRLVGQFYTPAHIVDYCFERATDADEDKFIIALKSYLSMLEDAHIPPDLAEISYLPSVLDPSCGTGNFLLGALRFFGNFSDNSLLLLELAGSCLFGFELDGRAAALTRIAIMVALADSWLALPDSEVELRAEKLLKNLRRNIKNVDTLYAAPDDPFIQAHNFALVITNPPYVSFGARNQPKLLDSATAYLRNKYPQSAEYKIRIHSIFQDISLRCARPGAVATLLIPDGFMTGGYYRKLRQLLLSNSKLRSFAELPADTVPGAVVGRWCVASYEKTAENSRQSEIDYSVNLYSHIDALPAQYSLPKSLLVSKDQNRFRIVFNIIDQNLCELIDGLEPLETQFQGRTGIRALHGQNSIVSERAKNEKWRRGITSGACVIPHIVTWTGDYIHIDPALLYKGGFDEQVIANPKILIRQTGDSLIAAYDEAGLYHLNNVHSLSSRPGARLSLHFIDGLLNSSFWLYLYRLKTREHGRALAQIDIETLESMPLPKQNALLEEKIGALTQLYRMIDGTKKAGAADIQSRINRAIDRLVYDLYELDETSVEQIERCCGKLGDSAAGFPTATEMLTLQQLVESEEVVCRS